MNIFCLPFYFLGILGFSLSFSLPSRKYIVSPCGINILQVRSSPEILPCGVTDEIEVVTTAVNEKICPEFNSDSHSKEVKIILYVNALIGSFLYAKEREKCVK